MLAFIVIGSGRSGGLGGKKHDFRPMLSQDDSGVTHNIFSAQHFAKRRHKSDSTLAILPFLPSAAENILVRAIEAGRQQRQQPRGDKKNSSRKRNIMHLRISRADIFVVYHSLKSFVVLFCARDFLLFSIA